MHTHKYVAFMQTDARHLMCHANGENSFVQPRISVRPGQAADHVCSTL